MKYKHFDDINPSNKTDFIMLYFAACRSLRELEAAIRRTNDGNLTCRQAWPANFDVLQSNVNSYFVLCIEVLHIMCVVISPISCPNTHIE